MAQLQRYRPMGKSPHHFTMIKTLVVCLIVSPDANNGIGDMSVVPGSINGKTQTSSRRYDRDDCRMRLHCFFLVAAYKADDAESMQPMAFSHFKP
jgi:hypothetical protein